MRNGLFWGVMTVIAFFIVMVGFLSMFSWEISVVAGGALLAGIMVACTFIICEKYEHWAKMQLKDRERRTEGDG